MPTAFLYVWWNGDVECLRPEISTHAYSTGPAVETASNPRPRSPTNQPTLSVQPPGDNFEPGAAHRRVPYRPTTFGPGPARRECGGSKTRRDRSNPTPVNSRQSCAGCMIK